MVRPHSAGGERILTEPVAEYGLPDGVRLLVAGQVRTRINTLAMLFQLSGDQRFAERAWDELEAGANFPDWHPPHFLDTATMTHAFGIGYDWLHSYWTPERRQVIRDAIVEMGLSAGIQGARSGAWWVTTSNDWNIVCHGGLGIGALSVADEAPEPAEEILRTAQRFLPHPIAGYAPDGPYPEGVGYWHYATMYLVPYLAALRTAVGDDLGLADSPGLAGTGYVPIYLAGPEGSFNYYDSGSAAPQPPEMFWLAKVYERPIFSWWGMRGADANPDPSHLLWYDPDNMASPYGGHTLTFEDEAVVDSPTELNDLAVRLDPATRNVTITGTNLVPSTDVEQAIRIAAPWAETVTLNGTPVAFVQRSGQIHAVATVE